jgi:hypothetical protein
MSFDWRDHLTVRASGPIEHGDAAKFAALPKFDTLELNSPGGLVGEALTIAANMDARGGIRTVVKSGSFCASACSMALFVSGKTRIVYMGGRLGIHSCANPDGTQALECNKEMAANATSHGVPWGVIEGFGNEIAPSKMMWLGAEDAECWGLMKWSAKDESNHGVGCFLQSLYTINNQVPAEVNLDNANDILCRMNALTSRIHISTGRERQGLSDTYRRACEQVVMDTRTPKYAAIDIIMWLMLTDPNIMRTKPWSLAFRILDSDMEQINNCWKCLTILGMSGLLAGNMKVGLEGLQAAREVVKRDLGSVPTWLNSRIEIAAQAVGGGPR